MGDVPPKKRARLNAALAQAISAHTHKSVENIEKPIALALISDNKAAKGLLANIQAQNRPKQVLESTLKVCEEKKSDAHVEEAFLSVFGKYFGVLGIDSATECWQLIESHLKKSGSMNEAIIAREFINKANLLGQGFGKLVNAITNGLPSIIKQFWSENRTLDAQVLSYSFVTLLIAENAYLDNQSKSSSEFFMKDVFTNDMRSDVGMSLVALLACSVSDEIPEKLFKLFNKSFDITETEKEHTSTVFQNHFEFFNSILPASAVCILNNLSAEVAMEQNKLKIFANRIKTCEMAGSVIINQAAHHIIQSVCPQTVFPENYNGETSSKDVLSSLNTLLVDSPAITLDKRTIKQIENVFEFLEVASSLVDSDTDVISFSILVINLLVHCRDADAFTRRCENILLNIARKHEESFAKLRKTTKKAMKENGKVKIVEEILNNIKDKIAEELLPPKLSKKSSEEIIELLNGATVGDVLNLLEGVPLDYVKLDIFDAIARYVEDIPAESNTDEIRLYKKLIEVYGETELESLCLQIVFSRLAADGWCYIPPPDILEQTWFERLVHLIDLLDTSLKSAKNTILKSFTALYCQLLSQILKNVQRYVKNSVDAIASKTLTSEEAYRKYLKKNKLIQDVVKVLDNMKRNESFFAMLAGSIIGETVFYGSDFLLPMSRLHSLADKNTSALLATNLPAVERMRYKKFLSTITTASKKVY